MTKRELANEIIAELSDWGWLDDAVSPSDAVLLVETLLQGVEVVSTRVHEPEPGSFTAASNRNYRV